MKICHQTRITVSHWRHMGESSVALGRGLKAHTKSITACDAFIGRIQALFSGCFQGCSVLQMGFKRFLSLFCCFPYNWANLALVAPQCINSVAVFQQLPLVQLYGKQYATNNKSNTDLLHCGTLQNLLTTACFCWSTRKQVKLSLRKEFELINTGTNLCNISVSSKDCKCGVPLG